MTRHPDPQLRLDRALVEAEWWGVPAELARQGLRHQPGLATPAKLVLAETGEAGVLAEIPRSGALASGRARALEAIETAIAWLEAGFEPPPGGETRSAEPERVEAALAETTWRWEREQQGGYRVGVNEDGVSARAQLELEPPGLRVAISSAVPAGGPRCADALRTFALEANRRLRLARMSVMHVGAEHAELVWDAVLSGGGALDAELVDLVHAVVCAKAETAHVLRALGTPPLAEAYLRLRVHAEPPRDGAARE